MQIHHHVVYDMNTPARLLFNCIQELAARKSNPVLEILPDDGIVKLDTRYPQPMLTFDDTGLRAYYHCHTTTERPVNEHGHFHIFIRNEENDWSHLAGLSMDNHGQPLQWFSVNHWVTGEQWNNAETLVSAMQCYDPPISMVLTEKWLMAMLEFYMPVIEELLLERDDTINSYCKEWQQEAILQERSIYFLSGYSINLLDDLSYPDCHGISVKA
jgi:hypothetical protein